MCGYKPTDANIIGLQIMSSLFDHGLLLTPEELSIPVNPASTRKNPPGPLKITQRRACFTLLEFEELFAPPRRETHEVSHVGAFGEFAVGLDPVEARLLGVMPTFYYYHVLQNTELFEADGLPAHARGRDFSTFGPSSELLFRLAEIRSLLVSLAHIEALGAPEDRAVYRTDRLLQKEFIHDSEPHVLKALSKLSPSTAKTLYSCIDTDRVPAWNLIEWLDILLNAFQVADSRDSISSLEYYQQREWRIIQLHSPFFDCYPLLRSSVSHNLSRTIRRKIATVYETIANHAVTQGFRFDPRNTFLLAEAAGRPFGSFIRELVVPVSMVEDIEMKLRDIGIPQDGITRSFPTYGAKTYARLILSRRD
jgi:hypothetical protein